MYFDYLYLVKKVTEYYLDLWIYKNSPDILMISWTSGVFINVPIPFGTFKPPFFNIQAIYWKSYERLYIKKLINAIFHWYSSSLATYFLR